MNTFTLTKPSKNYLHTTLWVLAGSLLLAISAQLSIPLKPVPITFQSATVLLIGMVFGARLGSYMVLAYIAEGFLGLPVFANFYNGFALLTDPSIGYVVGFLPAAFVCGYLVQRGWGRKWIGTLGVACIGTIIIFTAGVIGLACVVGLKAAIALGVTPFLLTETVKILAVSVIAPRFWREQKTR